MLHPLLAGRFSPLAFDPARALGDDDERALVEAARWAPSAGNAQPWMFHVRRRGAPGHDALVAHLAGSSRAWAPDAAALVVNIAHTGAGDGMRYSDFAEYDLGQAVAHMTIQAAAMGLSCRQFRAFDLDGLTAALDVPGGWEVLTMTAVGRAAGALGERSRRAAGDLRLG